MKILITGGTGFIGSALARYCRSQQDDVTVLGQTNTDAEQQRAAELAREGFRVVLGSVTDGPLLHKVFQDTDAVVHLAAAQHETDKPDSHYEAVNVGGTRTVLEACVRNGVRRYVHGSTIGVYGDADGELLDEDAELHPSNVYGRTKVEGEKVVAEFRHQLATTIVRISETYGPGDMRLLKLFRGVRKGWFPLIGSGQNMHQPICVDDLVVAIRRVLANDAAIGETFILAGSAPVTTTEMIDAVASALNTKVHKIPIPLLPLVMAALAMEKTLPAFGHGAPLTRRRLDFFDKSFRFSVDKAQRVLGFAPAVSFWEGSRRCAEWYMTHGFL